MKKSNEASRQGQNSKLRSRRCACSGVFIVQILSVVLLIFLVLSGRLHAAPNFNQPMQLILPECTVTAGAGVVDFGSRSRGQLGNINGGMTPGTRTLLVSASCTLPQVMKLRLDGMARGGSFNWGGADSILRVRALRAQLDGEGVQLQRLNNAGVPEGQPSASLFITPGDGLMAVHNGLPVHGKQLSVTLEIVPVLGEKDSRPVQRAYPEASLSITLVR